MSDSTFFSDLSKPCPEKAGTRIRLTSMPQDPCPIEVGEEGTVEGGSLAQMLVKWDSGRTLYLLPDVDTYEVIESG